MKKFLSLVLALVMTMSLVTVAGAKDFTDAADVTYPEAVDVISALGIVGGYGDSCRGKAFTKEKSDAPQLHQQLPNGSHLRIFLRSDDRCRRCRH